ncbi:MAG TPA: hypothetical protein VFI38_16650 [Candidatus Acidoferrum sp.]|nr:hypothetical protein [Candidatus Acidoferrum sp.]
MGPAPAARLEPVRSEDRERQEKRRDQRNREASERKMPEVIDKDRVEVAATEPEEHKLDERA